jgi:amino acid transporter
MAEESAVVDSKAIVLSDEEVVKRSGYQQTVLHRGLGAFSNFAFGFTEVAVLASYTSLFGTGLSLGGPSAMVWTYLVTWFFLTLASFSMAEICSAFPFAGSVYHWSAQLVPPKWAPLASYITGWTNFLGNLAGDASFASFFASFFNAGLEASQVQKYDLQPSVGVAIGVLLVWSILNFFRIDKLGWVNTLAAVIHAGSIIVIIVVVLVKTSSAGGGPGLASNTWVFTDYENASGFTDDSKQHALNDRSYIGAMSIGVAMFAFSGFEASAHMAEETHGMATAAPWGIIWTVFATGLGGFAYMLALLFAITPGSLPLITNTKEGNSAMPFLTSNAAVNVFINSCGWQCGSGLTWLVVINLFFAGFSSVAVTARITFSLLRDHAFPFSDALKEVHPTFKSPIRAIMLIFFLDSALLLLGLNPTSGVAFTAIVGLCVIGFMVSYAIPIMLKTIFQPTYFPTAMSLGKWSTPCGVLSCLWLYGTSCLFLFPKVGPLTLLSMNWLIVVIAGVFVMGVLYWQCGGGKERFRGPPIAAQLLKTETYEETEEENAIKTEEYLAEAYIDEAAARKKQEEETVVGRITGGVSAMGGSVTTAVASAATGTGAVLSTVVGAVAKGTDAVVSTTVNLATTGNVSSQDPRVLTRTF